MNPLHRVFIPALLALLLVPATHAARTYKWVDEDGVTHYTQYPPPDQEAQVIEPDIGIPTGANEGSADSEGQAAEASDGSGGGNPQTIEAYCERLRSQLKLLNSNKSVSVKNEDGSLTSLEGDARAQQRADIATRINQNCSN